MNTQERLGIIVHQTHNLANRLQRELECNEPLDVKVDTFIREITQAVTNYRLDTLVRNLIREERRTVISQEIDVVGPGATVVGAKIDRIG